MATPIVSMHQLTYESRPAQFLPGPATRRRFDMRRALLGPTLGLSKLGCGVIEVPPGACAYPFHSHRANDELFVMLAGSGELRLGDARHAVAEGDIIGCPSGDASTAHQLLNSGTEVLRYLAISTLASPEICEYPDSGKVGAYSREGGADFAHFSHYTDDADYWLGE